MLEEALENGKGKLGRIEQRNDEAMLLLSG
jgi:hypothetical protein